MGKRAEQNRHYLCKYFYVLGRDPRTVNSRTDQSIEPWGIDVSIMLHDRAWCECDDLVWFNVHLDIYFLHIQSVLPLSHFG